MRCAGARGVGASVAGGYAQQQGVALAAAAAQGRRAETASATAQFERQVERDAGPWLSVDGLPNAHGVQLASAIDVVLHERRRRERTAACRERK